MHLMKLEVLLKVTGTSDDINEVFLVETCLPKCSEVDLFLQFPFSDTGQRIILLLLTCFFLTIFGSSSKMEETMHYKKTEENFKSCQSPLIAMSS